MSDSLITKRRERILANWENASRNFLALNHPSIIFESDTWLVPYTQPIYFRKTKKKALELGLDPTCDTLLRCIMSSRIEAGVQSNMLADNVYRALIQTGIENIFSFLPEHFDAAQERCAERFKAKKTIASSASTLEALANLFCEKGIIDFSWHRDKERFNHLYRKGDKTKNLDNWYINNGGYTNVDHRIAAFTDILRLAFTPDEDKTDSEKKYFGPRQEQGTLFYVLKLCAPARINEVLSMTINDIVTLNAYQEFPLNYRSYFSDANDENHDEELNRGILNVHRAHQRLFDRHTVLLQKGSKGAKYSAKPVLQHMNNLCGQTMNRLRELGTRSRMLARYYEDNPDELYYPPGFEYLKDKSEWTLNEIHRITHFCEPFPDPDDRAGRKTARNSVRYVFAEYSVDKSKKSGVSERFLLDELKTGLVTEPLNPSHQQNRKVEAYDAEGIKKILLKKIRSSEATVRNITTSARYYGKLSEMLCLSDYERQAPFLIGAIDSDKLQMQFAKSNGKKGRRKKNLFDHLGIRMIQFDEDVPAWIDSHDFRRFLTDNALECKNAVEGMRKLSDVLINSWANRKDIGQLSSYRRPFSETTTRSNSLHPSKFEMRLLEDLGGCSEMIKDFDASVRKRATDRGLTTFTYSTSHGSDVTIALSDSLDRAHAGIDSLGKVRTMIPLRHGSCLHDHVLHPCQHIVTHCFGCNQRIYTKGDEHRYAQVKKIYKSGFEFLYRQMEHYVDAIETGKMSEDDAKNLFPLLVNRDLDPAEMTNELIELFELQYERLKEWPIIFQTVEEAFVSKRNIEFECDDRYKKGDSMRYLGDNKAKIRSKLINDIDGIEEKIEHLNTENRKRYKEQVSFVDQSLTIEETKGLLNRPYLGPDEGAA